MGWRDRAVRVDSQAGRGWRDRAVRVDEPDVEEKIELPASGLGQYLSESAGALKTGAREFAEGAKETVKGLGRDYMEGARQHPGALNLAGPIYGVGNALLGLASSPAAEFAEATALGLGGVEFGPPLKGLRFKDEPPHRPPLLPPGDVARAVPDVPLPRAPEAPARTLAPERTAGPPPREAALPTPPRTPEVVPQAPTGPSWRDRAIRVEDEPLTGAPQALAPVKIPKGALKPALTVEPISNYKSPMFPGADGFKIIDAEGKHLTNVVASRQGDRIEVHAVGGKGGDVTARGDIGPARMRQALTQLQEHYPGATSVGGTRITGARARAEGQRGRLSSKTTEVPLPERPSLRPSERLPKEGEFDPELGRVRTILDNRAIEAYSEREARAYRERAVPARPSEAVLGPEAAVTLPPPAPPAASRGAALAAQRLTLRETPLPPELATDPFLSDLKRYNITGAKGGYVGEVELMHDPANPERVSVVWVGRKSEAESGEYSNFGQFRNTLGPANMRGLLHEIKRLYPEATEIGGDRVSGARRGQPAYKGSTVAVPLPRAEAELPRQPQAVLGPEAAATPSPPLGVAALAAQRRGGPILPPEPPRRPSPQAAGATPTGYPELSTAGRSGAQAILQQRIGLGEREATKAITALEPYQRQFNALPRHERLKVIDYMENRTSSNTSIRPEFKDAADEMRRVYKDIEYRLAGTTSTEDMKFIEDYFRHQVKDPNKVPAFLSAWKEGSAMGAGKKRTFPTVTDLLSHGHELVNDNPIEVTMGYAYHMNRFIATNEAFDIAKAQGTIKSMSPSRVPDGWLPIEGRHGGMNIHGQANYAPAAFAKPWNNFMGQGFTGLAGEIRHGTRAITNMVTAVKLMGGYHFATMAAAAFTSDLARAFDNLSYGRPAAAGRTALGALSIIGPVLRQLKTGLRGQKIYAGKAGSAEETKIVDYLTQAYFRPSRIDKTISVTQAGNLYTAWKRGALSHQLRSQMSDIAAAPGVMKAVPIAKGVWNLFGRTIDTTMAPLFEKFIPTLKTGAAMESLRDFLIARPAATFEEIMVESRAVQRNMDDRFGEMNHDNLFWNQKLKESLQSAMLSYSWNVGIARALGGGGKDMAMALGSKATGGKFGSADWTRRASYALAFPVGAAYLSAVYQALKTGQPPRSAQDLLAPLTGGVNPATKYRKESDERILIPGHMKDAFEVRDMIVGDKTIWDIAANKLNPALRIAGNLIVGRDWRGNPITDPEAATQDKIKQYLAFAIGEMAPIALSQYERQKVGTGLNLFETVLGVRPAPDFLQDPTGHGDMMRAVASREWIKTLGAAEREAKGRGDHERATSLRQEIHRRQKQMKRISP